MPIHFKQLAAPAWYPVDQVECLDDNLASEFASGAMAQSAITKVEAHLASCRDCRALVAALAGSDDIDSNVVTHPRDPLTESQAGKLPALSIGDRVGRYLVLSTLGAGGMGMVFAAYDPQLDRKIALKVLRTNLGPGTDDARKRLKREAQAIAQLNHPNVVGVYDVGTTGTGDDVYIAMEFVEGDTLTTWLKRWPRTWREILEVFAQAGRGLIAAHGVGLLHRDFKPDNVLVGSDGRVRVTDFGLARSLFGIDDSNRGPILPPNGRDTGKLVQVDLTATGTVLGTPRYMPPEQLTGPNIDARSDQFSFCVALYEALYGSHPLAGATSVQMLEHGTPALPPPVDTRVPAQVNRAVMRGLAKDRSLRFAAMAALMTELTPPDPRPRTRLLTMAALLLLVVGGATAAVIATRNPPTKLVATQDEEAVAQMVKQIGNLEAEVKSLRQKVLDFTATHKSDLGELDRARSEVVAKEQQIDKLVDEVTKLRVRDVAHAPVNQATLVGQAVATAQRDIAGCFDEWAARPLSAEAIGNDTPSKPHPTDSDLLVTLQIAPDGSTTGADAKGEDANRSPSLKDCVENAVARVHFPTGSEALDLEVAVTWNAPDMVNTSARVVGHHLATQPSTAP